MDLSIPKNRSRLVIMTGLSTIIVFLMVLLGLWINTVNNNEKVLKKIAESQLETGQIYTMRDAALRRALTLHRMSIMEDPFDRQDELVKFREYGSVFIGTRNEFLSKPMSLEKKFAWDEIRKILTKGGEAQNRALDYMVDEGDVESANKILLDKVVPIQDHFLDGMTNLLNIELQAVDQKIDEVTKSNLTTYWLIGLLGSAALLLFIFTIYVLRKTDKTEDALMDQGKRIRELYEVSSRPGLDIDEQVMEMLKLGKRLLNLEIARVCKINPEAQTNTFMYVHAPDSYGITPGKIVPLDKSFCNITYHSEEPIAVSDISHSSYAHTPYHEFSQLESYIAAKIYLHGIEYGTVNFSSRFPCKKPFTDTDKDLVNLIGSWVSLALERKQAQEELFHAKENAEAANQSKSAFLANMSHELRTPLNAIIGYSELIVEDLGDTHKTGTTTDLKKITSSGHHLLSLINDILDLSKIEAGKMEFSIKETNIPSIINEVIDTFRPSLKENNIELVTTLDEGVTYALIDKTRLKQTLINLVGNAVKFTQGGTIRVELSQQYRYGKYWTTIAVVDSGIGIPQEAIGKIFQPFQQVSKETSVKYGGTGLGLAISQRICRMMGGDITVASCQDEGSTFTIWLPVSNSASESIELIAKAARH